MLEDQTNDEKINITQTATSIIDEQESARVSSENEEEGLIEVKINFKNEASKASSIFSNKQLISDVNGK